MPKLKFKDPATGEWIEVGGAEEVHVGPFDPTKPEQELWIDTDDTMALIKYKDPVTGQWVPVVGASKEYIDAGDDKRVLRAGDTMTGPLVLPGNATTNLQAVPKQQLDAAVSRIDGNLTALETHLNGIGTTIAASRGKDDTAAGTASVGMQVILPSSPAGSLWRVDWWLHMTVGGANWIQFQPIPDANLVLHPGPLTELAWRVFDTSWHTYPATYVFQVQADGAGYCNLQCSFVNPASPSWTISAQSRYIATRIK